MRVIKNPLSDAVVLDFETYYDKEYSLRTMTTQEYILDSRFEPIMLAYKEFGKDVEVITNCDLFETYLKELDLENKTVVAHNAMFDVGILTLKYGIKPKRIIDTMGLANCFIKPFTGSASLAKCAEFIGAKQKGTVAQNMSAVHYADMTRAQIQDYIEYCKDDVEICHDLLIYVLTELKSFRSLASAQLSELENLDSVIRMGTEPKFELDERILSAELLRERGRKTDALNKAGVAIADVMSNQKFEKLLNARGVQAPTKTSPTTGKSTLALAKSDLGFLKLLDDPRVADLVRARLECKSTINETRLQKFINVYRAHPEHLMCMPLNYYGAKTGRLSGSDSLNVQNLTRGSELRNALKAPRGYKVVASDLCIAHDSKILTDAGLVNIQDIKLSHKVWDGQEWVTHDGLIYKGIKEVITYDGVTATPDHRVYTADGRTLQLSEAAARGEKLAVGARGGEALRVLDCLEQTDKSVAPSPKTPLPMRLWSRARGGIGRLAHWEIGRLWELWTSDKKSILGHTRVGQDPTKAAVQCAARARKSKQTKFKNLRRHIQRICQLRGLRSFCLPEMANERLHWFGGRSERQQWQLQQSQHPTCNEGSERPKPWSEPPSHMEGSDNKRSKIASGARALLSRNNGRGASERGRVTERTNREVRVYDILNAGKRNRFTCDGKIVSNCQIEARLVATLSKCGTLIDAFRMLDDVYSWFGSDYLFPEIEGGINKKNHPKERFLSKTALLSLGYAAGAQKFHDAVNASGQATIDMDMAESIVGTYRRIAFPEVPALWKYLNGALEILVEMENGVLDLTSKLGTKVLLTTYNTISMRNPKNPNITPKDKAIILPNGMPIVLKNLRKSDGDVIYDTKTGPTRLYGASLLEKICQGIARIIISQVQEEVRARYPQYKPVLQVHDEVVYIVKEQDVDMFKAFVNKRMSEKRDWIPLLPVDGESDVGDSYGDAK